MPNLTRRRDPESRHECWHVYYGDVRVGAISIRVGVPNHVAPWGWSCGFYPGSRPGEHKTGAAASFDEARDAFEAAWRVFLAARTEDDFAAWRYSRDFTAWKYAMWEAGMKMPTQIESGRARCFCGAEIDNAGVRAHVLACHASAA